MAHDQLPYSPTAHIHIKQHCQLGSSLHFFKTNAMPFTLSYSDQMHYVASTFNQATNFRLVKLQRS